MNLGFLVVAITGALLKSKCLMFLENGIRTCDLEVMDALSPFNTLALSNQFVFLPFRSKQKGFILVSSLLLNSKGKISQSA